MMGQSLLIRNSRGDYRPAHRSIMEFLVGYKLVAALGAMAPGLAQVELDASDPDEEHHRPLRDRVEREDHRAGEHELVVRRIQRAELI